MKNFGFVLVLCAVSYFLNSCSPALQDALANSINQSTAETTKARELKARQEAVDRTPPVIGAKCVDVNGQLRLNQLQQGPNACFFSALVAPQLGEISRVDVVITEKFTFKTDIEYQESYEAKDDAWRGQRIGFILPLLMPYSFTSVLTSGLLGVGKLALSQVLQAKYDFLIQGTPIGVSVQLPKFDAKTAQYFDPEGNFRNASSRFKNLGERPYYASIQLRACSIDGICIISPITPIATR